MITINNLISCYECGRSFDLLDEEEANEFYYGHDCEGETV